MSVPRQDATALRDAMADGQRRVSDVVEETLARIGGANERLEAFSSVDLDGARRRARELDRSLAGGEEPGPLFGLPMALKSNLCVEGLETNCGSRILAGYRAPYTATAVRRMLDAGAVPVGMTHMDEFAMGSSGENSAFARPRNPWDLARTPGGSSSGSAAAVAADLVPLALGSDTGGSVRQPAALCGIVGFKPTYGRISRFGLMAFGSSLDQISPLARSVRDVQLALSVLSGGDPMDATSLDADPVAPPGGTSLEGLRIGVPDELFPDSLAPGVRARVEEALGELRRLGAETVPVRLPHAQYAIPVYYVVATAEASSNLARFDGVRFGPREPGDGTLQGMFAATREAGFGDEVKRRILLGTYVLSSGYQEAWYGRARRVRGRIAADFERVFAGVDLIACPTSPTPAFRLGERADDPVAMYLSDVLTVPANLAGLPAVSVPCGLVEDDGSPLPVGLQLVGPPLADAGVLGAARAFEEATGHHLERPGEGGA